MTISVTGEIDEAIANQLSMSQSAGQALPNVIVAAIDRHRERLGRNAFMITRRPVENSHGNVALTLRIAANRAGEPYRIALSAVQGNRTWARTIERGRGNERPGFTQMSAGEEGPMMTLNQRLAASLIADGRDLGSEFAQSVRD
jgi:hypothetical protein